MLEGRENVNDQKYGKFLGGGILLDGIKNIIDRADTVCSGNYKEMAETIYAFFFADDENLLARLRENTERHNKEKTAEILKNMEEALELGQLSQSKQRKEKIRETQQLLEQLAND